MWLYDCMTIWLYDYMTIWLCDYVTVTIWLYDYMTIRLYDYVYMTMTIWLWLYDYDYNALRSWIITFAVYREARKNLSNLQKPFLGKNKKTTGNPSLDQDKRVMAPRLSLVSKTILSWTIYNVKIKVLVHAKCQVKTEWLISCLSYRTSLDHHLGNTTMNRNECTSYLLRSVGKYSNLPLYLTK